MKEKRELLFSVTKKDLTITWYKSGGAGGQKKNKTANACRIQHPDSGAMVTASERRERHANLKKAFHRLLEHPKFKVWHQRKCYEVINKIDLEKEIKKAVDATMKEDNLKIEVKKDGKWVEE